MKADWKPIGTHPVDTYMLAVVKGYHPFTGEPFTPVVVAIDEGGLIRKDDEGGQFSLSEWKLTHWDYLPKNPAEATNED